MTTQRTYCVILPVHASTPDKVSDVVDHAIKQAREILKMRENFPALECVVLLVPRDNDCGRTFAALRERILAAETLPTRITPIMVPGHPDTEALNHGAREAKDSLHVTHAIIATGEEGYTMAHLHPAVLLRFDQAFGKGAKVAGLAAGPFRPLTLIGSIQNSCIAAWELEALISVGGFRKGAVVAEARTLVRLGKKHRQCVAPIDIEYGASAERLLATESAQKYHILAEQIRRQHEELALIGCESSKLVLGIMPGYPGHV